jgi:hypothetical protein
VPRIIVLLEFSRKPIFIWPQMFCSSIMLWNCRPSVDRMVFIWYPSKCLTQWSLAQNGFHMISF